MTQYPSPYSPPLNYGTPMGYGQPGDLLTPARRAGIMMIVLGSLTIVFGLCMGVGGAMLPSVIGQMQAEQAQALEQMQQQLHMSLTTLFMILAAVMLVVGLLYIIFGILTRRGGLGIVIASIVLTSLTVLYLFVNTLGSLFTAGGPVGACFSAVAMGLFILLLVWLVQAARASSRIPLMQAQYQAQYQQYAQMQQMYGQAGYGYGAPAAPPSAGQPPAGQAPNGQSPPTEYPPTNPPQP